MCNSRCWAGWFCALTVISLTGQAHATFHLMQIEEVIAGVNGDMTAQAIQLRMRTTFQTQVNQARIRAWDAAGLNPILVCDLTTNVGGATGSRILIASPGFADYTGSTLVSDFTISNLIPASYLAAGRLTFESDFGAAQWSFAWGGAGYTGSHAAAVANDANNNFGPAFAGPLPSIDRSAVRFTGAATAPSVTNAGDYALTTGAATFVNNLGTSFLVVSRAGDANGDGLVTGADFTIWADGFNLFPGTAMHSDGDFNHDGFVTGADFTIWADNFGSMPGPQSAVPEPASLSLVAVALAVGLLLRRRVGR